MKNIWLEETLIIFIRKSHRNFSGLSGRARKHSSNVCIIFEQCVSGLIVWKFQWNHWTLLFNCINTNFQFNKQSIFFSAQIHSRDISELCRKAPSSCDCPERITFKSRHHVFWIFSWKGSGPLFLFRPRENAVCQVWLTSAWRIWRYFFSNVCQRSVIIISPRKHLMKRYDIFCLWLK